MSQAARSDCGLPYSGPLSPWSYADQLGIVVLDFARLAIDPEHRLRLTVGDPDSWSGLTLKEGGRFFVVLNPAHPMTRQRNTLMHEVAHIVLKHVPGRVDVSETGLMLLSEYPDDQEQEADWLAAALLLPRDALRRLRYQGLSAEEIAPMFEVSSSLVEWRLRMTGIENQIRNSRRAG